MMTITSRAAAIVIACLFLTSAAVAQSSPPAEKTDAAAPAAKKAAKPRTAESIACSKEADAKNIHGKKDRGPFMRECKRAAKEAAAKK